MKTKILLGLSFVMGLFATSCSEDTIINNYDVTVENVEVTLDAKELINVSESVFNKTGNVTTYNTAQDYTHVFPTSYKAYFVSKENRGNFTTGQVVKVIDVVSGGNSVIVPKLDYDVYVTNYIPTTLTDQFQTNAWYTWSTFQDQLPQTAQTLYLFGKTTVDFKTVTVGNVDLVNYYAGVEIRNNSFVNGTPMSYHTSQNYFVGNSDWYVLYIRNNTTNTKVPVSMAGYNGTDYTLNKPIQANKIYKYTINGNVDNTDGTDGNGGGNFNVEVEDFEAVYEEDVDILI